MAQTEKILIAGTGKSGIAAAKMALSAGASVILYNSDPATDREKILELLPAGSSAEVLCGSLYTGNLRGVSLAVISPGIPTDADFVSVIDKAGVPLIGELELAYQASRGMVCGITGTNGKTTTTSMVGEIMKATYRDVHVAGNIGTPFSEEALQTGKDSVSVLEVSSFMLETIHEFHPKVSAILNITPDHLNRHKTMENYIRCKEAITMNQTEDDYVVLNYDDEVLRAFGTSGKLKPHVVWFSSRVEPPEEAVFLRDGKIIVKDRDEQKELLTCLDMNVIGRHNYENACAAAAVSLKMGADLQTTAKVLLDFKAVEHRIEFVRERSGVRYYNDSKGTNTDAAIQALNAMPGPVVLIGGGYDKGGEFDDWVSLFPGKVKQLVLLGQTRDRITQCCRKYGFDSIAYAESMEEAVQISASYASIGDYVLLSPACASWGMFRDFEERGRIFKDCVRQL